MPISNRGQNVNRLLLRYAIISAVIFCTTHGMAAAAAGEDVGDRLEPTKVARSGEKTRSTGDRDDATGSLSKVSLSSGITLPTLNPNPVEPQVELSEQQKKACLKQVGDKLDDITIKDVTNRDVQLREVLSDRLTVLILWSEKSVAGYEQFRRIPVDVLAKFAPHRIKVVAANVGGTVQETQRLTGKAANKVLSLADRDAALFKQFATTGVPRTYVLDAEGRVVWFDIEYSESTRRALDNTLTYFIQQTPEDSQ